MASCHRPYLLPGCHNPQLDNSIFELLLTHNGDKRDACVLTVLQLIQQLGVLLVQHLCLGESQSTTSNWDVSLDPFNQALLGQSGECEVVWRGEDGLMEKAGHQVQQGQVLGLAHGPQNPMKHSRLGAD